MRGILISLILLTAINGNAQEWKKKRKSDTKFKETFFIDKVTKARNGKYVKIDVYTRDTLVVGHYFNNMKVNTWKYYGEDKNVFQEYDYDKGRLKYIRNEVMEVDSFVVKVNNDFILTRIESPPIYIGFENEVKRTIYENCNPGNSFWDKEVSGVTMVSFIIDKKGQIKDIEIESGFDESIEPSIINSIRQINGYWIPAKLNGQAVESKIYILYDYLVIENNLQKKYDSIYEEKPYLYVIEVFYQWVTLARPGWRSEYHEQLKK